MTTTGDAPQPQAAQPTTTAAPEAKTPFQAAAKVVRAIHLSAVRFRAVSARALDGATTIPENVAFDAGTKFLKPVVVVEEGGFSAKTTLLFQLGGKEAGSESSNASYASISATLEAVYTFKPDATQFSEEEIRDFAFCYCPFHVWGYWREFVQSSLARLDLPQFTLPLFLIEQAPKMVQEKLD
jgi:hypothetical protein